MNRIQIALSVVVALVLGVAAVWQSVGETMTAPTPSSTTESESMPTAITEITEPPALDVKAVSITSAKSQPQTSFALREGDSVASWDFKSAYTDNPELVAKAENEIKRLSGLLVVATSSYMIIAVGIANQYELLGDGKNQYDYLGRAIQASPDNGLPWHNLGVLMERLGAIRTAKVSYEKSTLVQPEWKFYHYAYIEFLTSRTKDDVANIEKAFAFAEKNIGKTQYLIDLRAEWQKP